MKTNENGIYDARTLGLPKMLILGLQHMPCSVQPSLFRFW